MTTEPGETTIEQRLLDAALEAGTIHGIAKLSMGDVAQRADLSRQTLYRYFPSKEALVTAVVSAETAKLVEQVVGAAGAQDDPRASLEAGLLAALRVCRDHPLLDRLVRTEPQTLLPLLVAEDSPAMVQIRAVVGHIVAERHPAVATDPVALRRFADVVTRLLVSYAVSAPDDSPEVVAHHLAQLLVPDNLLTVPEEAR